MSRRCSWERECFYFPGGGLQFPEQITRSEEQRAGRRGGSWRAGRDEGGDDEVGGGV